MFYLIYMFIILYLVQYLSIVGHRMNKMVYWLVTVYILLSIITVVNCVQTGQVWMYNK